MNENWYAAQTIVGREKQVAARYSRFETFLPLTRTDRIVCRRTDRIMVPLFRGYFFLRCEPDLRPTRRDDFWGLLGAFGPGIGEPLPLADEIILELRERMDEGDGVVILPERFKIGQQVEILEEGSIYVNQIGLYQGQTDDERAIVLLTMLGGYSITPDFLETSIRAVEIQ